jgi:alpha-maltose-1-phosphate synthase
LKKGVGTIEIWDGTSIPEARQIAIALHEAGYEVTLHSSFYYHDGASFWGRLGRLPGRAGERTRRVLERRRDAHLEDLDVLNWYFPDAISRLAHLGRVPDEAGYLLANWALDAVASRRLTRGLRLVLVRQGSGVRTLARAKELGVPSVLLTSTPDPFDEWAVVHSEVRKLGLKQAAMSRFGLRLRRRIRREYLLADFIIASSEFTASTIARSSGRPLSAIKVIPLTCDVDPAAGRRDFTNGPKDGHSGPFRVLFVGSVSPRKGLHYLVPAVRELAHEGVSIQLDVVGPTSDRDYLRVLTDGGEDGIVRFRGPVPHQLLADEYLAADVFVLPSLSDSFGMAVVEAKACGLPVLVTERCGALVRQDEEGFVVPAGDARELKRALRTLIDHPELRLRMGREALRTIQAYSWADYRQAVVLWLKEFVLSRENSK